MLIKSLTGLFALATCFGISQVVTDLLPSECEALCNVRITDLLDQGPAVTYDWSQAVHGACECTEVYGTQDDQSECVFVSACSGSIGFSFTGGPNIRPGGLVNGGPATWCQDGLWSQPLLTHSDPPPNWDGTSPIPSCFEVAVIQSQPHLIGIKTILLTTEWPTATFSWGRIL